MMGKFGEPFLKAPVYDMSCDIPLSTDAEMDYNFEFETPLAQQFTANSWIVDTNLLSLISEQPKKFHLGYEADIQVQARGHRKKRINKKWLKRYGYKTVRRKVKLQCEQITMTPDDDGLGVRFGVEGVRYV